MKGALLLNPRPPGYIHSSQEPRSGIDPDLTIDYATRPNTHGIVNHRVSVNDRSGVNTQANSFLTATARIAQPLGTRKIHCPGTGGPGQRDAIFAGSPGDLTPAMSG